MQSFLYEVVNTIILSTKNQRQLLRWHVLRSRPIAANKTANRML
jgi:hypothetical protein